MIAHPDKRVLILHTGGTLGMQGSPLVPAAYTQHILERVPELRDLASVEVRIVSNLDSSDIGPPQWVELWLVALMRHVLAPALS